MSFILDALKKSESDRQRQSGPALFEVKVAPPRPRLPLWALVLGLLLVANAAIVGWVVLRRPAHVDSAMAQPAAVPGAMAAAPGPAPGPAAAPLTAAVPASAAAPAPAAAPATAPSGSTPAPAAAAADDTSSEDVEPATDAPPVPASAAAGVPAPTLGSHVRRGTADGVPLYQDVAAMPNTHVPELRLDLHVYAQRPEERFVMINMKKLREGDSLPEGVHVDSITPEGAVLTYAGSRFLLPRD
ncbi:MAG: general secretion pathway protein GspB [Proteobacteria bacterium]|nr:general secretion pathway protein GspB [Pseudomonadota bacterium]